ncbi:MAG TPA: RT0821/Lpp0805 family surface protein [Azospirillaceae bacterium]|nr:RT0821/Lpp0805 family surface protein [Azospirillaceae bacterium]
MLIRTRAAALAACCLTLTHTAPALADPPPWAPAHGYREKGKDKHKHKHKDRDDRVYVIQPPAPAYQGFFGLPLGLEGGSCDRGLVGANLGTLLGAVAGGLGGSQIGSGSGKTAATIGGVLVGAALGNALFRGMAGPDQGCFVQTLERAPTGQQVIWNNPDNGARYQVTPTRTYEPSPGQFCREYTSRATVGGRNEQVTGTACRQPDGAWKIVS